MARSWGASTLLRKPPPITVPLLWLSLWSILVAGADCPTNVGDSGVYSKAAVATDAAPCSKIGVDILKKGGSAVDAAISSLLCVGVVNLHSTGIGGGGFMLFYDASTKEMNSLDYREVAPQAATYDMFDGLDPTASHIGGLSVAVPGELRGLEMAWKKWGHLRWEDLFIPVIELAREGFPVTPAISHAIQQNKDYLLSGKFPGLSELLAPNGELLKENDILKRPIYADTLEKISKYGAGWFYEGDAMKDIVQELREDYQSILTEEDFSSYAPLTRKTTASYYKGLVLRSVWTPSGGPVMSLILNILDKYGFGPDDFGDLAYHRIVEAFKFAYGQRLKLGDPAFSDSVEDATRFMLALQTAQEMFSHITDDTTHDQEYYLWPHHYFGNKPHDHGTSHLSVLAENGDAVACTGTINLYFGSLIRSRKYGIIFNDEMDDFSFPNRNGSQNYKQTEVNYIEPGKRPLSSMAPTIVLDREGKVKMVVGASGGFKITTAVSQVLLDVLGFEKDLSDSIALRRLHHQLFPNYITVEQDFPANVQASLRAKGHKIVTGTPGSSAVVQGIFVDKEGVIHATSDTRKGGSPDGY